VQGDSSEFESPTTLPTCPDTHDSGSYPESACMADGRRQPESNAGVLNARGVRFRTWCTNEGRKTHRLCSALTA